MVSLTSLRKEALYVNCSIRLSVSYLAIDNIRVVLPVPATASTITLCPSRTSFNIICCSSLNIIIEVENLRYINNNTKRLYLFTKSFSRKIEKPDVNKVYITTLQNGGRL